MEITQVPIGDVRPHPRNARQGDVGAIVQSIRTNGVYRPLIVQRSTGYILAGNHTWRALNELEHETAPVCYVDADDDQALRILLVDNRASDLGTYDDGALTEMLVELATATDKALAGTGYDAQDLERMIEDLSAPLDLSGATFARETPTPAEGQSDYYGSAVRPVVLPASAEEFEWFVLSFSRLRADRGLESNTELVKQLVQAALAELE